MIKYEILVSEYLFPSELYSFDEARRDWYYDEETGELLPEYTDLDIEEIEEDYNRNLATAIKDYLNSTNFPFTISEIRIYGDETYAVFEGISAVDILRTLAHPNWKEGVTNYLHLQGMGEIEDYLDAFMCYFIENLEVDVVELYYHITRNI